MAARPAGTSGASSLFRVYTKSGHGEEHVETLLGEYGEQGMNHGRKFYKKLGDDDPEIFLYYWDDRDGPDLCGWWFGDDVGGANVWSRANAQGQEPPSQGWKVPWDGPARRDVLIVEPAPQGPVKTKATVPAGEPATPNPLKQARMVDEKANQILASTKEKISAGLSSMEEAKEVEGDLRTQHTAVQRLIQAMKIQMRDARPPPAAMPAALERLQNTTTAILTEGKRVRNEMKKFEAGDAAGRDALRPPQRPPHQPLQRQQAQQPQRQQLQVPQQAEVRQSLAGAASVPKIQTPGDTAWKQERDNKALQDFLPQATQLAQEGDDAVDNVAIMAAPFSVDDVGDGAEALAAEIQDAFTKAAKKLGEAKRFLQQRQLEVKRYVSPVKEEAQREIQVLQQRHNASVERLTPFKNFKADFEQKVKAKQAIEDIMTKLSNAELEVEKAHIMTAGVAEGRMSEDEIKNASQALKQAQRGVDLAMDAIRKVRVSASDNAYLKSELDDMSTRTKEAKGKITEVQKILSGQRESLRTQNLISQADDAVHKVEADLAAVLKLTEPLRAESAESITANSAKAINMRLKEMGKGVKMHYEAAVKQAAESRQGVKGAASQEERMKQVSARLYSAQAELAGIMKLGADSEKKAVAREASESMAARMSAAEAELDNAESQCADNMSETDLVSAAKAVEAAQDKLDSAMDLVRKWERDVTSNPALRTHIECMLKRGTKPTDKLVKLRKVVRAQKESLQSKEAIEQVRAVVKRAEEVLDNAVTVAEAPYLTGIEVLPIDEARANVKGAEAAAEEVAKVLEKAKNVIAEKIVDNKRYSDAVLKAGQEELAALSDRAKKAFNDFSQFKKDTERRKRSWHAQEAIEMLENIEADVQKMREIGALLGVEAPEGTDALSTDEATKACKQIASMEKKAQAKIETANGLFKQRRRESKSDEEMATRQDRLNELQSELAKTKSLANEWEQRFVANRLVAEARSLAKDADTQLEALFKYAEPLIEGGAATFLAMKNLALVVEALRGKLRNEGCTIQALFQQIHGGAGTLSRNCFAEYVEKLPAQLEREDLNFIEEQINAMFKEVDVDNDGEVSLADFEGIFCEKYTCVNSISLTDSFDISSSKILCKIELDDAIIALSPPTANDKTAVTRLECKHVSSGKVGWVTMKGNLATTYFEPFSPFESFLKKLDRDLKGTEVALNKAYLFVKTKVMELGKVDRGPLLEGRNKLSAMKAKVLDALKKYDDVHKRSKEAREDFSAREETERSKQQEARDRKLVIVMLKEIEGKADDMDAAVRVVDETVKKLVGLERHETFLTPSTLQDEARVRADLARSAIKAMSATLDKHRGTVAKATRGPYSEAKKSMSKLAAKADKADKQVDQNLASLRKACDGIAEVAKARVCCVLRENMQKRGLTVDGLFDDLAAGAFGISEEKFCTSACELLGEDLPREHAVLLAHYIAPGILSRRNFCELVQQYFKCIQPIALTNQLDIRNSKSVRKLDFGEYLELVEGPKGDHTGAQRVKGKALLDGATGWITVTGNQGTIFLKEVEKPYVMCVQSVELEEEFAAESPKLVRRLKEEEVLEVLEGPSKVKLGDVLRGKVKACTDAAAGWITIRDSAGSASAALASDVYSCTSVIAMTDGLNVKKCKPLRKLDPGEALTVLEGPTVDELSSMTRIRAKAARDGLEGWVTVQGNAGTIYAEKSSKHYVLSRAAPLHKHPKVSDPERVRDLSEGEVVELLDGPREERLDTTVRVKGRAISDGAVGWVTKKGHNLAPWSPWYECASAVPMYDARKVEGAKTLRRIEVSEVLEATDGPVEEVDGDSTVMRLRGRAKKDGMEGWMSIRGPRGMQYLVNKRPS